MERFVDLSHPASAGRDTAGLKSLSYEDRVKYSRWSLFPVKGAFGG